MLARLPESELNSLFVGYGYKPYWVEGNDPAQVHQFMAATLDVIIAEIKAIKAAAKAGNTARPQWPMIIMKTPKGWTGPKVVDGKRVEDSWRAHQVPVADIQANPAHLKVLEDWMKSYRPQELFDETGKLRAELQTLAPTGDRRMGHNPHANGGKLTVDLRMPDFRAYAVPVVKPGTLEVESTAVSGKFLRDVMHMNAAQANFRVFGPDETASNRLQAVFEESKRTWMAESIPSDDNLACDGRVMEILSEHTIEGWLEGYLLTGRHGFFSCYEAFIHLIDSMFNQHAKWLKTTRHIPWRRPIPSMNYLLTSHVWRQDHNGFSHQDPGFIDHVVNKKSEVIRIYLPPDANCLLNSVDHCLRSKHYVNVIVAGKQPALQFLDMPSAEKHCTKGLGIWEWASNDQGVEPDVVVVCCGDVPTLEALAAVDILRKAFPTLHIRFVNIVDLMAIQHPSEHPHGISDKDYDLLFTNNKPVMFVFHGYPWLIHRLIYRRRNHDNVHVRGYKEEGTTTTPFDMCVLNQIDRFTLAMDVIDRVPGLPNAAHVKESLKDKLIEHKLYVTQFGIDMPEVSSWKWPY